jgi:ABC-type molybdate transport system ATPase subunit
LLAKKTSEAKPMAVTGRLVLDAGRQTTVRVEGKPTAAGEPLKVVVFDRDVKTTKAEASGSSLRMSADGKTAAVIAADGSVTVFDTASGKEMMRFPVKK